MRVVIAAGGTGGHFYPGLAVAKALRSKGGEVKFIVRNHDYVIPLLEREKIPFDTIPAAGLQRRLSPKNLLVPFKVVGGIFQSFLHLWKFKPDFLLAMGGYLSVPPVIAAKFLRIPSVLHEQNVTPGLANKMLSRMARTVAVSFPESRRSFNGDVRVTGNPIREDFRNLPEAGKAREKMGLDAKKKTLLVFGGSLGSRSLNELVVDALGKLSEMADEWQVLHFTGMVDEATVRESYAKMAFQNSVSSYCHDMPTAYGASDLVICRAGATTVSELMAVRRPAILVPYPFATANHQLSNAHILSSIGAAHVAEEKELKQGQLKVLLEDVFKKYGVLASMRDSYQKVSVDPFKSVGNILDILV